MDDVLLNKAAIIERCLYRISGEYQGYENELETNLTKQDSIILNLLRACEASIDAAMHLVRINFAARWPPELSILPPQYLRIVR